MWIYKNTFAIGGLENVGYASKEDLLIVLSSEGQGIFDCVKGEKISRQTIGSDWWNNFNETNDTIKGFGILDNLEIQTYGLYGQDQLLKRTLDGWELMVSEPESDDKPFEQHFVKRIYLISPDKQQRIIVGKDGPCELRAFGFSETGNSFIIASSCDLNIYSRT